MRARCKKAHAAHTHPIPSHPSTRPRHGTVSIYVYVCTYVQQQPAPTLLTTPEAKIQGGRCHTAMSHQEPGKERKKKKEKGKKKKQMQWNGMQGLSAWDVFRVMGCDHIIWRCRCRCQHTCSLEPWSTMYYLAV